MLLKITLMLLSSSLFFGGGKGDNKKKKTTTEQTNKDYKLDPKKAPSENFNLKNWYLSVPTDKDKNGKSDSIYEEELNSGYQNSKYFYTAKDGGMVFKCPTTGYRTSTNTKYVRVELREMLRKGNDDIGNTNLKNNWVFNSAPDQDKRKAGAIDGEMFATLKVDKVTTTGEKSKLGRVVIGQIHAKNDEPLKIYYRKLPYNNLGSIYIAHEINNGDDEYYNFIGNKKSNIDNPFDGIALGEVFSYNVKVAGDDMWVTLIREGKKDIEIHVDMSESNYNQLGEYMYFKAGLYHLNNTGAKKDYAQVTFYELNAAHYN